MTSPGITTWNDLPKFNGEHFHSWKNEMSSIFREEGLMDVIEGKELRPTTAPGSTTSTPASSGAERKKEWDDKNLISLAMLKYSLDAHQHLIARYATAAEAWAELNRVFGSHDLQTQMQLRDALHTLKMKTGESAAKHIIKFRLLLAQLASVGQTIAEAEAYTCLLRSLPIEYRSFVRSMRLQHTLTTQSVIASLLLEASHLQEEELNDKMAALYTDKRRGWTTSTPKMMHPKKSTEVDSSSRQKTPSKSSFPMQKMKCSYCKKQGHLAQECRKKKQDSAVEDRLEMLGWYRQLERNVGGIRRVPRF
ncbi:hypothetical protein MPTK1_1g15480 [Marchantia polymorpha subsp. ruderalis]